MWQYQPVLWPEHHFYQLSTPQDGLQTLDKGYGHKEIREEKANMEKPQTISSAQSNLHVGFKLPASYKHTTVFNSIHN